MPQRLFFTSIKTFWGIPGGAGLLSSTVWCNMIWYMSYIYRVEYNKSNIIKLIQIEVDWPVLKGKLKTQVARHSIFSRMVILKRCFSWFACLADDGKMNGKCWFRFPLLWNFYRTSFTCNPFLFGAIASFGVGWAMGIHFKHLSCILLMVKTHQFDRSL